MFMAPMAMSKAVIQSSSIFVQRTRKGWTRELPAHCLKALGSNTNHFQGTRDICYTKQNPKAAATAGSIPGTTPSPVRCKALAISSLPHLKPKLFVEINTEIKTPDTSATFGIMA